jgi:hypothetical protein
MPDAALSEITQRFVPENISKGDFLLKSGRICDQPVFLSSGFIRVYAQARDKEAAQWVSAPIILLQTLPLSFLKHCKVVLQVLLLLYFCYYEMCSIRVDPAG